jgi:DNA-binding transcriptional MocR family regulator
MPDITLDRQSKSPLYRQIVEQFRSRIFDGSLQSGTKLPTIRRLAKSLGVSKLTVFHAYNELQEAGLIECTVGYGTVVAAKMSRTAGEEFLSTLVQAGPLNTFESVSHDIGVRSLATAVPDPTLFFADEFLTECYALRHESPWTFYYAPPAGCSELLVEIAELLDARCVTSSEQQILVTNGLTHARSLVLSALTEPGDTVLYQEPMGLGTVEWFLAHRVHATPLRADDGLLDLDELERFAATHRPKLLFVAPSFGHVTGTVIPDKQRKALLALASKHDFLIVEDDSTGRLSYDSAPPAPIAAHDVEGRVIYADSFSYCLSPGLRTGFLHARRDIRDRIVARSRAQGISGTQFVQIGLARFLRAGRLQAHLARVLPKYRVRRDAMMSALRQHMPAGTRWTQSAGGFSTWLHLPPAGRYGSLYHSALENGVAISPGPLFSERPDADAFARLSFGTQSPEAIRRAIETLGRLVSDRIGRNG